MDDKKREPASEADCKTGKKDPESDKGNEPPLVMWITALINDDAETCWTAQRIRAQLCTNMLATNNTAAMRYYGLDLDATDPRRHKLTTKLRNDISRYLWAFFTRIGTHEGVPVWGSLKHCARCEWCANCSSNRYSGPAERP